MVWRGPEQGPNQCSNAQYSARLECFVLLAVHHMMHVGLLAVSQSCWLDQLSQIIAAVWQVFALIQGDG